MTMLNSAIWQSARAIDNGLEPFATRVVSDAERMSDLDEVRDLWEQCQQAIRALRRLEEEVGKVFANKLGNEALLRNGTVYSAKRAGSRTCEDPEGFQEWLGTLEDVSDILRIFNPQQARITAVRAVAEKNGYVPETIEKAFFKWTSAEDAEPKPQAIPISKALKWQQGLKEGEHRAK